LTSSTPNEMPGGGAVAAALDLLASFSIVGIRQESDQFRDAVAELMGVDSAMLPSIPRFSKVAPLAQLLQNSKQVDGLLETDLELYHYVNAAIEQL
jgi:hypothetical protein